MLVFLTIIGSFYRSRLIKQKRGEKKGKKKKERKKKENAFTIK